MKVLLIEDELQIADFVCAGLAARGLNVMHCADGHSGFEAGRSGVGFEAIVLDLMLPGRDGLSVLAGWRAVGVHTPVILLTARNELGDRIAGLNLGADDYLAKPFYVEELHARLLALRRRLSGERQTVLQVGAWSLDRLTRAVSFKPSPDAPARSTELTPREHATLALLMRSPGQVVSRSQLLEQGWGHDFDPGTNVVDVCVKRLRAKVAELIGPALGADVVSPIESVRGAGYRFRGD